MKNISAIHIAAWALCLLFILTSGCSDDPPGKPEYAVQDDPGPDIAGCCGVNYTASISGVSPAGGRYYWLGALRQDSLVTHGESLFIPQGSFADRSLSLYVSYLDNVDPGEAELRVFSSDSATHVGVISKRAMEQNAGYLTIVNYADSVCRSCCTKTIRRYKCWVAKDFNNVIGAAATIQTRWGRLCGEGTATADTAEAQSCAWVGIQDAISPSIGSTVFAQIGYEVLRLAGSIGYPAKVDTFVYLEFWTSTPPHFLVIITQSTDPFGNFYCPLPQERSDHRYSLLVDPLYGYISYSMDGVPILPILEVSGWKGRTVKFVSWQGEINGRESDMPGIRNDPCYFKDCTYTLNGQSAPNTPNFSFQNYFMGVTPQASGGPDEWGIDTRGGSSFSIWDEFPLIP